MDKDSSQKKILICLIGQLGNGGSEKQLYLFLKYLDKTKYKPVVIVSNKENNLWEERLQNELNISIEYLRGNHPLLKLLSFRKILNKIKQSSFKIHSLSSEMIVYSWSFYTNVLKIITPKNIPFIGSLRVQLEEERKGLSLFHFKLALSPELFVVNSRLLLSELQEERIEKSRIRIIHNIFEPKFSSSSPLREKIKLIRKDFRKKLDIPDDAVVVLGVGRDSPGKDFPFFVKVLKEIIKMPLYRKNIYGCIIGKGGNLVKEMITRENLTDKIILTGEISEASQIFPFADVFFLSSKIEGMPNVLLEAIDAGCGIIATNVGGVSEITGGEDDPPYKNGLIIENGDISGAVEGIKKLITDNMLKDSVTTFLQRRLSLFSPDTIMRQYTNLLSSIKK